jgi:DNA gyrase/topoisomerase IV subunit A
MVTPEKIEAWLKEAEERPESAVLLLRYIANQLRDLSARNEELLAENITLQNGERVEEYKQRIAHLEYQLALLKRRFGEGQLVPAEEAQPEQISLLAYDLKGRVLRLEANQDGLTTETLTGRFSGELLTASEPPRLLAIPSQEELLFLFTSGRVSTHPAGEILPSALDGEWVLGEAALPDESHSGERLVSLLPFTQLPLAEYFLQASRRGCVKKTMTTIADTILTNHFIGRGIIQKADQPFEIILCRKQERLVLVTWEGCSLCLDVDDLTYAVEERMHLAATDHVVAAFIIQPEESLLVLTQTGKVILRAADILEPAHSPTAKGQPLIPPARRDQGVRAIGATHVHDTDRVMVLHGDGKLTIHTVRDLSEAGAIRSEAGLLAFTTFAVQQESR